MTVRTKKHLGVIAMAVAALTLMTPVDGHAKGIKGELTITPELTREWQQWALSIPASVHPLTVTEGTPEGEPDPSSRFCMVGQHGNVWFLGGVFKFIPPAGTQATAANDEGITPIALKRVCKIPLGVSVLMPVINAACSTAEGDANPEDPVFIKSRDLRECAKGIADEIQTAKASFRRLGGHGGIDLPVERVRTLQPYSVAFPPDNILGIEPQVNPSLAQADGFFTIVKPEQPGTYVLRTFGEAPAFDFALDITYILRFVGPQDQ